MSSTSVPTAARVAAVALAGLATLAGFDTAVLVAHTVDGHATAGRVAVSVVAAAITAVLGWGALRLWRRGGAQSPGTTAE